MALTANQQAKMTELESLIKEFKETVMNSPYLMSGGTGAYFFDTFEQIDKKIAEVKNA